MEFVNNLKADEKNRYWVVSFRGTHVAVVYLNNISDKIAEWGYYLAPEFLNSGFGFDIALSAFSFFKSCGLIAVFGDVKAENLCNIDLQRVLCDEENELNGYIRFKKNLTNIPIESKDLKSYKRSLLLQR